MFVAILVIMAGGPLASQEPEVPTPVRRGLDLLQTDSAQAAIDIWAAEWKGPADAGKADQIAVVLRQFAAMAGRVRAYDILRVDAVGPHLRRVYVLLRYERLPVYAQFVAYEPGEKRQAWMVASVKLHTDAEQALPPTIWPR